MVMASATTPAERRMGACETTPPATPGPPRDPQRPALIRILPRFRWSAAARRHPARSSSPLRGCGRSSWTPPARRREPGSCEEDPEEQSGPARRHHASHRVMPRRLPPSVRPVIFRPQHQHRAGRAVLDARRRGLPGAGLQSTRCVGDQAVDEADDDCRGGDLARGQKFPSRALQFLAVSARGVEVLAPRIRPR